MCGDGYILVTYSYTYYRCTEVAKFYCMAQDIIRRCVDMLVM